MANCKYCTIAKGCVGFDDCPHGYNARLAALREVREMVLIRTGWIVEAIDDLIKREEEGR